MGISGLLLLLKSIQKPTSLKSFAGQTVGIDAYGWLHRGAAACALELALEKPTTKYVEFVVNRVRMLLDFGITPYLVFDGASLPSKAATNEERRKRRKEAKTTGMGMYNSGRKSLAYKEFQSAVEITFNMTRLVIEELRRMNIRYIVAPYEADAQLVYLERTKIIDAILSEDSDMLVFGARRLLTKLDQYGGCVEINRDDFASCREVSLIGWTDAMFRRMAILSGCDYLRNIPKLGLRNAYRYVRTYKDLDKMFRMIQFDGQFTVPSEYPQQFKNAESTFLHQRVFCPLKQRLVFLEELPPGIKEQDVPFLGDNLDPDTAIGVACGELHPSTKAPVEVPHSAAWSRPAISHRNSLTAVSSLKPSKSIDSFFKPRREPLAELDPNLLTPSHSQRRLLQTYSNASWEMRTASSAPQLRRAATSTPTASRTPEVIAESGERASFLAKAATISTYKPPKRQRLCCEQEEVSPSKEVQQSPFFAKENPDRPVQRRSGRPRKARKSDFEVWSDDSISDEALLALASVQQPASPDAAAQAEGKEELTVDEVDFVPQSSPIKVDDRDCASTDEVHISDRKDDFQPHISHPDTAPQNASIDLGDEFEDLLELQGAQQTKSLFKTFLYQSPGRRISALASLSPVKKETDNTHVLFPLLCEKQTIEGPREENNAGKGQTFLEQSLSQQANALRSLQSAQRSLVKIEIGKSALKCNITRLASSSQTDVLVQIGQQALERNLKEPTSVRPENEKEKAPSPKGTFQGSEDCLVPDTEDEASVVGDSPSRGRLNLQAYTFTKP